MLPEVLIAFHFYRLTSPMFYDVFLYIVPTAALSTNSTFAAGILSDDDLKRYYRTSSLYISNPYTTMGLTGTSVSRRYVCLDSTVCMIHNITQFASCVLFLFFHAVCHSA